MQIIRIIFSKRFYVNSFVRTVSVDEIHQMTITIHKLQLIHFPTTGFSHPQNIRSINDWRE